MNAVSEAKDDQRKAWQHNREKVNTVQRVTENQQKVRVESLGGVAPTGMVDVAQEFFALLNGLVGSAAPIKTSFVPPLPQHGVAPEPERQIEERVPDDEDESTEEPEANARSAGESLVFGGDIAAKQTQNSEDVEVETGEEQGGEERSSEDGAEHSAAHAQQEGVVGKDETSEGAVELSAKEVKSSKLPSEVESDAQAVKGAVRREEGESGIQSAESPSTTKAIAPGERERVVKGGEAARNRQTIGQFDTVLPTEGQPQEQVGGELKSLVSAGSTPAPAQSSAPTLSVAQQTAIAREGSGNRVVVPGVERGIERVGKVGTIPVDVNGKQLAAPREFSLAQKLPPGMQAKIVNQIQKLLDAAKPNGNQMVVRLDPPELGAVTVRLTVRGEQMFARLVPESPDVESVLRERAPEIVQAIAGGGIKAENVHVTIGREPQEFGYLFEERHGASRGERQFEEKLSPRQQEQDWRGSPEVRDESDRSAPGWVA